MKILQYCRVITAWLVTLIPTNYGWFFNLIWTVRTIFSVALGGFDKHISFKKIFTCEIYIFIGSTVLIARDIRLVILYKPRDWLNVNFKVLLTRFSNRLLNRHNLRRAPLQNKKTCFNSHQKFLANQVVSKYKHEGFKLRTVKGIVGNFILTFFHKHCHLSQIDNKFMALKPSLEYCILKNFLQAL